MNLKKCQKFIKNLNRKKIRFIVIFIDPVRQDLILFMRKYFRLLSDNNDYETQILLKGESVKNSTHFALYVLSFNSLYVQPISYLHNICYF